MATFKRLAAELFCGGHDNGNKGLEGVNLQQTAAHKSSLAVQVHANQEKMEDDDLNGRSHLWFAALRRQLCPR